MAQGRKRKRRRRGVLYAPIAVVLVAITVFFGISVFFRVTEINVSGQERYTADQILSASQITEGDNLLLLDPKEAAKNIMSRLPYVSDVVVEKLIPDKVAIAVTESRPVAAIQVGAQWWLLDQKGRALEQAGSGDLAGKVRVEGLSPQSVAAGQAIPVEPKDASKRDALRQLLQALDREDMVRECEWVDVSNIAALTMRYGGRFTVVLGKADDVDKNIARLKGVIAQLEEGDKGRIDLTSDAEARFIPET